MWKNIVEPDSPQTTIRRMRIAGWIPKATNTHSKFVILIDFTLQQWADERDSIYVILVTDQINAQILNL